MMEFIERATDVKALPWSHVRPRLGTDHLSLSEVASLLTDDASENLETLARAAHDLTVRRFGRTIKLYAPVYLSNECINGCLYCGFNRSNEITRRTLSIEEAIREANAIMDAGHRHVLLVAGEHPRAVTADLICEIAESVKRRAASVAIETQPFTEGVYARLAASGVDGVTLYQETYDKDTYARMHPFGPKRDFQSRILAIDAAGSAGMRFLGLGALLGLNDWRFESLMLVAHARYLMRRHWKAHLAISVPRIRDCASGFRMPHPVSDRNLTQMICALRLALPDCGIILSTRESPDLRDNLLPLGITQMSAGSVTSPGGYTGERKSGEQFHLEDTRSPTEVAHMLKDAGYDPVWKDWDKALNTGWRT